ncbi:MAG: TetR/AcrR family transcriptional regulator [Thermoanaerobacterales bacterium]|nr:TetR/AcrR family transcriptional regulator [Thermoanaerobacterales bacterium]
MGGSTARRLAPEHRKALLIGAARETFATRGYTQAGLAEVAELAGVSKTLLYHYFPDGRPELYRHVMAGLVDEVTEAVGEAVRGASTPEDRLAGVVEALVGWFDEHPDAYRLLVLEPWGSGEPAVIAEATAVRARLATEVNAILAAAGEPLPVTMVGGAAALGAVLHACELCLAGQVSRAEAVDAARRFVTAGLRGLGLV